MFTLFSCPHTSRRSHSQVQRFSLKILGLLTRPSASGQNSTTRDKTQGLEVASGVTSSGTKVVTY